MVSLFEFTLFKSHVRVNVSSNFIYNQKELVKIRLKLTFIIPLVRLFASLHNVEDLLPH